MSTSKVSHRSTEGVIDPFENNSDEGIHQLPEELLFSIFSQLNRDIVAISTISLICRKWRRVVFDVSLPQFSSVRFSSFSERYALVLREQLDIVPIFQEVPYAGKEKELKKPYLLNCGQLNSNYLIYIVYSEDQQSIFCQPSKGGKMFRAGGIPRTAGDILLVRMIQREVRVLTKGGWSFVFFKNSNNKKMVDGINFLEQLKGLLLPFKRAEKPNTQFSFFNFLGPPSDLSVVKNIEIKNVERGDSLFFRVWRTDNLILEMSVNFSFAHTANPTLTLSVSGFSHYNTADFKILESEDYLVRYHQYNFCTLLSFIDKRTKNIVSQFEERAYMVNIVHSDKNEFTTVLEDSTCKIYSLVEKGGKKRFEISSSFNILSLTEGEAPRPKKLKNENRVYGFSAGLNGRSVFLSKSDELSKYGGSIYWMDMASRQVIDSTSFVGKWQDASLFKDCAIVLSESEENKNVATLYHYDQDAKRICSEEFSLPQVITTHEDYRYLKIKMLREDYWVTLLRSGEKKDFFICGVASKTGQVKILTKVDIPDAPDLLSKYSLFGNNVVFTGHALCGEMALFIQNIYSGKTTELLSRDLHPVQKDAKIKNFRIEIRDGVEVIAVRMQYTDPASKQEITEIVDVKVVMN